MKIHVLLVALCCLLTIDRSGAAGEGGEGKTKPVKVLSKGYTFWKKHGPPGYVPVSKKPPTDNILEEHDERLRCYACNGLDTNPCMLDPAAGNIYAEPCPKNELCAVIRTEYPSLAQPDNRPMNTPMSKIRRSRVNILPSSESRSMAQKARCEHLLETEEDYNNETQAIFWANLMISWECADPVNVSVVNRSCRPYESIHKVLLDPSASVININSSTKYSSAPKVYATYCASDRCNTGDGRLRCYECKGEGRSDTCMTNPAASQNAKVITCGVNEFCYMMVLAVNKTTEQNTTVHNMITRGCSLYSSIEDDEEGAKVEGAPWKKVLAVSCASDLCNTIDGNMLVDDYVNSARGTGFSLSALLLAMISAQVLLHELSW